MAVPPSGAGAVGYFLLVLLSMTRPTVQITGGILNLPELPDQTCGVEGTVCCAPNNYRSGLNEKCLTFKNRNDHIRGFLMQDQ